MTLSGSLFHVLYDIEEQIIFNDWSNCRLVMLHYLKRFLFETNMVHTEYLKSNKQDRERERESWQDLLYGGAHYGHIRSRVQKFPA